MSPTLQQGLVFLCIVLLVIVLWILKGARR